MFLTIVCQPEYSGTFEVISVAEYHESFIQKKLKKTFVHKSILDKKAINCICIGKYTCSQLFFVEFLESNGKIPV